jgi:hypothetical protein
MLSRRILTLSLLLTAVSGYLVFFIDNTGVGYYWILGTGIAGAMMAYVFQHQLNWWWYRKYPPFFPSEMEQLYLQSAPFYIDLDTSQRREFQTRVALFIEAKEFIAQGFSEVAEEIKYIIGYYAVAVSFGRERYAYSPYDRIVIYLHPFLSPHFPDTIHAYEIEHTDGTIIFSLEQLTAGFLHPQKYYQIGYHVFGELYQQKFISQAQTIDQNAWAVVVECSGWTQAEIENFVGLSQESPVPSLIHLWFSHHPQLRDQAPALYDRVKTWVA